ncbi:MAG: hypothetical protein WEB00_11180 [Dehalococcoidia bacterium]
MKPSRRTSSPDGGTAAEAALLDAVYQTLLAVVEQCDSERLAVDVVDGSLPRSPTATPASG